MQKLNYDAQESWSMTAGLMQSPIAITSKTADSIDYPASLELYYDLNANYVRDTGQGLEVGLTGTAIIANRPFRLQQFHIHAPSEHTLDGESYDGEIHFVHEAADGRLAVIGVFLQLGAPSETFANILSRINDESVFSCEVTDLLPTNRSYYHYIGSLTTPPLSENVDWYVLEQPMTISAEQLAEFHVHYDHNNRHLQPLNGRHVLYYQDK